MNINTNFVAGGRGRSEEEKTPIVGRK